MSNMRRYLPAYSLFDSEPMSTNLTSASTNIAYVDQVGIQITSINTDAVGQWSIEGSADNTTFVPIEFNPPITSTTSGDNDLKFIDMKFLSFPFIRVVYTRASGDGLATVKIVSKGL